LHAAFDYAGDEALGHADIKLARGKVIQKKQWFSALHDYIIDAHGDQIDAHGIVAAGVDREAKFGAYPVGTRYQHWPAIAIQRHFDQGAETAYATYHLAAHRAPHVGLDSFDEFLAGVDIDSSLGVSHRRAISH
jgi:hypothetical protein